MRPNSETPTVSNLAEKQFYRDAIVNGKWEDIGKHYEEEDRLRLLFPLTVSKDTPFHMAVYSKTKQPLEHLLEIAEEDFLTAAAYKIKNAFGNTALHVAAVVGNIEAVQLLVNKDRELLQVTNNIGETPLFKAARYGHTEVVKFLASQPDQMSRHDKARLKRIHRRKEKVYGEVGDSILHVAIAGQHFGTALELLKVDESLASEQDEQGMIGLRLLANIPSAFESGYTMGAAKRILYSCLPVSNDNNDDVDITDSNRKASETQVSSRDRESGDDFQRQVSKTSYLPNFWRFLFKGLPVSNRNTSETRVSSGDIESGRENSGDVKGDDNQSKVSKTSMLPSTWRFMFKVWPKMEIIWREKRKHKFALELAKILIRKDDTWNRTTSVDPSSFLNAIGEGKPQQAGKQGTSEADQSKAQDSSGPTEAGDQRAEIIETAKGGQSEAEHSLAPTATETGEFEEIEQEIKIQKEVEQQKRERERVIEIHKVIKYETPLLAATSQGIVEIFYEMLREFPHAVEHYSHMSQNILHVAISHRQKEIFDFVKKMTIPLSRLSGGFDSRGYTILHCAADMEHYTGRSRPGPAYKLQDELKWFKRVEKIMPPNLTIHRDSINRKTAKELFNQQHKDQLEEAQKWIKETSQSCSTVAVLVATVVFAAAYTVPGGSNERGLPNFMNSPAFLFFTIMDVLSLAFSLTAVVMFLSILSSPFEMDDFRESLPRKLTCGFTLLFISVATTTLAFSATVLLLIRLDSRRWTSTLVYTAAFVPVGILAMTQFPLYVAFVESAISVSKFIKNSNIWKLLSCFSSK